MKSQEIHDLQQQLTNSTEIETESNIQMIFDISKKLDEILLREKKMGTY